MIDDVHATEQPARDNIIIVSYIDTLIGLFTTHVAIHHAKDFLNVCREQLYYREMPWI